MKNTNIVRCAIYTRKSTEEGLDMEFNSLDAQRESGENYIASQKEKRWFCLPTHYDDGGYSGGNVERPALKQLLADIKAGKIDIVVVYKIDRLSRSICDFAELCKFFDEYNVSFVSVTQDINTHTSAGRMMLNILVTFAQYEREIIGERIRDKVAASKRKGKYCGGTPPMGYIVDRETTRRSWWLNRQKRQRSNRYLNFIRKPDLLLKLRPNSMKPVLQLHSGPAATGACIRERSSIRKRFIRF